MKLLYYNKIIYPDVVLIKDLKHRNVCSSITERDSFLKTKTNSSYVGFYSYFCYFLANENNLHNLQ